MGKIKALTIQALIRAIDYLDPGHFVLKSKDGNFQCVPESALDDAYIMNEAESAIIRNPSDKWEIGHILVEYADGRRDLNETLEALREDVE